MITQALTLSKRNQGDGQRGGSPGGQTQSHKRLSHWTPSVKTTEKSIAVELEIGRPCAPETVPLWYEQKNGDKKTTMNHAKLVAHGGKTVNRAIQQITNTPLSNGASSACVMSVALLK